MPSLREIQEVDYKRRRLIKVLKKLEDCEDCDVKNIEIYSEARFFTNIDFSIPEDDIWPLISPIIIEYIQNQIVEVENQLKEWRIDLE